MAAKKKRRAKKHTGPLGGAGMAHKASVKARYAAAKREYHALGTQIFKANHGGKTTKQVAAARKGKKRAKKRSKK